MYNNYLFINYFLTIHRNDAGPGDLRPGFWNNNLLFIEKKNYLHLTCMKVELTAFLLTFDEQLLSAKKPDV